jgi:hypothetical protein
MKWTHVTLMAAVALFGCNNDPNEKQAAEPPAADGGHAHEHPSEGPHGGHLIELGSEQYHAELLHDDATGKVTVYILDGAAKEEVAIDQTAITINMVVDGKPSQFSLGAVGDSAQISQFEITENDLLEALEDEQATGRLNVTIAGKPYIGKIEHHDHDQPGQ